MAEQLNRILLTGGAGFIASHIAEALLRRGAKLSIVDGVLAALDYDFSSTDGAPFEVCNLGNAQPVKLSELVRMLEHATGRKAIVEREGLQQGDVPLTWADISKAGKLLGYHPQTTLEEGLKKFVEWYRAASPGLRA